MNSPASTSSAITNIPALTAEQIDGAKRLGNVAGLNLVATFIPDALKPLPRWIVECIYQVNEAGARGAGKAVEDLTAPYTTGFGLGQFGTLISLSKKPAEHFSKNEIDAFLNEYFKSYGECIERLTGEKMPPANELYAQFLQQTTAVFLTCDYDQKCEFIKGMQVALEFEKNVRDDTLNETTATRIYFELMLYSEEIMQMKNLTEVYQLMQTRFSENPALLGDSERFRKLANRIELSFRDQIL